MLKKADHPMAKLLLSTALVVVSGAYAYWQDFAAKPAIAAMPAGMIMAPQSAAPVAPQPAPSQSNAAPMDAAAPAQAADAAPPVAASPGTSATPQTPDTKLAMVAPASTKTQAQPADSTPGSTQLLPSTPPTPPPTLSALAALHMFVPQEGESPALPLVTGAPPAGVTVAVPAGTHLLDGEYISEKQEYEWGELRVKINVQSGVINAVQIVTYPDHRSQSLYLSQLASPILDSEVIKNQSNNVQIVASATNTSYAYRDAIASAILKATH